jgi:hypothetical protein
VLSANNYSSILTLAGTGQISLTSDYNANAVFIGLNASTLVTSNLTSIIVSTTNVTTSSFTLIDTYSQLQKTLYSYNGNLFLNGVAVSGAAASLVTSVNPGSNIIMGPSGSGGGTQGDVTVNVDMSFLASTVAGLGTAGYISTGGGGSINATGLVSTANLVNLVSTANLVNLVSTANLANLLSTQYLTSQLTSTVLGLGTSGYLSSLNSRSLSTGTIFTSSISFIDTSLNTKQLLAVNGGTLQLNGSAITGGGGTLPGGLVSTSYLENAILVSSIFNRSGVLNFSSLFVNSVPIVFDQYANLAVSFQIL